MQAVWGAFEGTERLGRKKASCPKLRVHGRLFLTFALAICTQFYVIIYYMIEPKFEFAIATQASNGA